jgi:signal transduction histidine kinase
VIDEGCGIDESVDLFAPFKRQGNKSGVGLGLFLAKSAAEAIGAVITLTNREDGMDGTLPVSFSLQTVLYPSATIRFLSLKLLKGSFRYKSRNNQYQNRGLTYATINSR